MRDFAEHLRLLIVTFPSIFEHICSYRYQYSSVITHLFSSALVSAWTGDFHHPKSNLAVHQADFATFV